MLLSIIIPTLNEQNFLPLLLDSIKKQSFSDYEIIVADAGSEDKTVEIAKNYGCQVVAGGLPAKGRNEGAKVAQGDLFLFLDADTILPQNFLKNALKEFQKRKLKVASCFLQPWGEKNFLKFLYNLFYNWPALILEKIFPYGSGFIMVKKEIHQKISGFDEEIKLSEDVFYIRRASKFGKFRMLRSNKIFYSQRRFEKEGWIRTCLKYYFGYLHTYFFGPVKSDIFKNKDRSSLRSPES